MKKLILSFVCILLSIGGVLAQTRTITGVVVDSDGESVIGASIGVKGTTIGTTTDSDGKFTINNVPPTATTIIVKYLGMEDIETAAGNSMFITMQPTEKSLEEVVVVGYGTLEKKLVTSSISSLQGNALIEGVGGSSIANALQGKISGLIISGSDSPNSGNTFQLRGIASINAGQDPLVVIDGVPGGDIRSVMQEDIASIDVLKDAAAGAIYGTRATAGVILITTKGAQIDESGKVKTSVTSEVTFKQAFGKPSMLNGDEYVEHGRGTDYGSRVDWWNESLADNPTSQRHLVTLQGGSRYAQLYASFSWNDNRGIVKFDDRRDYIGRFNANFKLLDGWLDIKTHVDYRQADRTQNVANMQQALRNNPTRSPYDPTSQTGYNVWTTETLDYNSIADAALSTNDGLDKWFMPDAVLKLNILPIRGLSYQQTAALDYRQWENHTFQSRYSRDELMNSRTGKAYLEFNKTQNINSDGYFTYVNSFNDHYINAVAGFSYYQHDSEKFDMTNYNFTSDLVKFWNMGNGTYLQDGQAAMESNKSITERLTAYFARVNYSYLDKYMLTGTIRHEGSSKFAINNRWGNFWSASGGWRLSKEDFLKKVNWINDLKLRVGYGITGNNNFGADYAATMYGSDVYWLMPDGSWAYSYGKSKNINNDLKWEEMHEWSFGLDYSLFNNRLYGKADYFRRKVVGMIYNVQVSQPPFTEQQMYENIGNMENHGWEFEIGGDVVRSKDWKYSTSLNLSHSTTKVTTLWGNQTYYDYAGFPAPGNPGNAIRIQEGATIGSFYLWKFAGFDDNGNFLLYNKTGDVIPAAQKTMEDKQFIGNYIPKVMAGWTHTLSYKRWDLAMTLLSWINFDVYNTIDMYMGLPNTGDNLNVLKDAYTKFGTITGEKQLCDFFLEDGTFLKIQNLNLAYNLNLRKYTKLADNARFYLTINNVATFTKYGGINPQVDITGFQGGIEWFDGLYPQTRSYALGVQLTF
ncbi:MAG: SusC/RagA family TonB-linked outer membrane protein [Candidatus Azobacteroides sp.]|nr:SusC/RagA family TonB-linked outer membrane protein [Candidatus Azobacteroides sp.]